MQFEKNGKTAHRWLNAALGCSGLDLAYDVPIPELFGRERNLWMKIFAIAMFVISAGAWSIAGCAPAAHDNPSTSPRRHGGGGHAHTSAGAPLSFASLPTAGARATCPVMKHAFTVKKGSTYSVHQGRYYVFCCPGCKGKFENNPASYIKR